MKGQGTILILGAGYTGRFLCALAEKCGLEYLATSRQPVQQLAHLSPSRRIEFDLHNSTTWSNLPTGSEIIWCFPARPLELVKTFADTVLGHMRQCVVLGSTAAYQMLSLLPGESPPLMDESSPLELEQPRVQGEEYLRSQAGAIVLRVAGIYGPRRNPLNWIRRGRVVPSPKVVNLIHVEDLAGICLTALEYGKSEEIYNVSDGTSRAWSEICAEATGRWNVPLGLFNSNKGPGKRISIVKLQRDLNYKFQHPDLYRALEEIESIEPRQAKYSSNS